MKAPAGVEVEPVMPTKTVDGRVIHGVLEPDGKGGKKRGQKVAVVLRQDGNDVGPLLAHFAVVVESPEPTKDETVLKKKYGKYDTSVVVLEAPEASRDPEAFDPEDDAGETDADASEEDEPGPVEEEDDAAKDVGKSEDVGRNDPCPCGSGKKYKRCCWKATPPTTSDRPVIQVRQRLTEVTDEAIAALEAKPELGVYVRAATLVHVLRNGVPRERWIKRPPGAPVISSLSSAQVLAYLDRAAEWVRWNERKKELVIARPPGWVADQVLARTAWRLPYLEAVIDTPTIRPDGSILDEPGYDEATGLLYEPTPQTGSWPRIPESPTKADVNHAVDVLLGPVADFPFRADTDKAAYVAAVLTLIARHLIDGPVPMFPVRAPTAGTGKNLLVNVIVIIGTGREAAVTQMAGGEELRKRITSLVLAGDLCVLLDDLSGVLGSGVLASAITAIEWNDRILGGNEQMRMPIHLVWFATGNNLGFKRTLGRRVVPIDLDAGVECPEDRTGFKHPNLPRHVRRERPNLVAAALTILRGFALAGRPGHGKAMMGSFEAWDHHIRSAVIWAGLNDPATTEDATKGRGRIRASADDDLEMVYTLLAALDRAFPNSQGEAVGGFTSAEVVKKASVDDALQRDLELAASNRAGKVTPHSVGYALRDIVDRPVRGFTLRSDAGKRPRTWWVEAADEEPGS